MFIGRSLLFKTAVIDLTVLNVLGNVTVPPSLIWTPPHSMVKVVELSRETKSTIHTPTRCIARFLRMSSYGHATVIKTDNRIMPGIVIRIAWVSCARRKYSWDRTETSREINSSISTWASIHSSPLNSKSRGVITCYENPAANQCVPTAVVIVKPLFDRSVKALPAVTFVELTIPIDTTRTEANERGNVTQAVPAAP